MKHPAARLDPDERQRLAKDIDSIIQALRDVNWVDYEAIGRLFMPRRNDVLVLAQWAMAQLQGLSWTELQRRLSAGERVTNRELVECLRAGNYSGLRCGDDCSCELADLVPCDGVSEECEPYNAR